MSLPNPVYNTRVTTRDVIDFRGLDRTDAAVPGSLSDCLNLSTRRYPVLEPRRKRTKEEWDYLVDATDLYTFNGKAAVVCGSTLYIGGTEVCTVVPGKKQWATVSGRLVVYPDELLISGDDPYEVKTLFAEADVGGIAGSVTMTAKSITAPWNPRTTGSSARYSTEPGDIYSFAPAMYTYGTDVDAVDACCGADGTWDLDALAALGETLSGIIVGVGTPEALMQPGQIFIPNSALGPVSANTLSQPSTPDKSQYNASGYFAIVTGRSGTIGGAGETSVVTFTYDVCKASAALDFSGVFSVGDAVAVSGTPESISDLESGIIREIDERTNTLVFDDNVFSVPLAYRTLTDALYKDAQQILRFGGKDIAFTPDVLVDAGTTLYVMPEETSVYAFKDGAVIASWTATVTDTPEEDRPAAITLTDYAASLALANIQIRRDVPDLDFICESGNRLWGLSIGDNSIRVSSLGDPTNFNVFDGVDTDSYALAVGSSGEWTGICAYGGGVCAWKEDRLHKILGSYPSEYYAAEYQIEGVASGSDRSLTAVNERLYYVGRTGVFCYTGGTPQRIGDALFPAPPHDAVGGSDGVRWYLSGTRWDDVQEMLVYDTTTGLWIKEDDAQAVAFAYGDGELHFLDADGDIWAISALENDDSLAWSATFAPIDETWSAGGGRLPVTRKYYLRLDLRLDMAEGSSIKAEVREDGGAWRTVHETDAQADVAKRVAILPRRCDRFQIRISGTGYVVLRAMTREFIAGSERV